MRVGDLDLYYLGNRQVAAVWHGIHVLPSSLIECDQGTLTAAEYVALYAIKAGKLTPAVRAFCMTGLPDVGSIEYAEGIPVH